MLGRLHTVEDRVNLYVFGKLDAWRSRTRVRHCAGPAVRQQVPCTMKAVANTVRRNVMEDRILEVACSPRPVDPP